MLQRAREHTIRTAVVICRAVPPLVIVALLLTNDIREFINSTVHSNISVQYREAVLAARQGNYQHAFALFENVLISNPNNNEVLIDYIHALSWAGEHQKLIQYYQKLPQNLKHNAEIYRALANAKAATGNLEEISEILSLILQPLDANAANQYLRAVNSNHPRSAIKYISQGLAADPDTMKWAQQLTIQVLHQQALSLARAENYDLAIQSLKELSLIQRQIIPFDAPNLIADHIVVLCWAHRWDEAIEKYLSLPANFSLPAYALSELYHSSNGSTNFPAANIDSLARFVERDIATSKTVQNLIDNCHSISDLQQLEQALAKIRNRQPEYKNQLETYSVKIKHQNAILLARLGHYQQALSLLKQLQIQHGHDLALLFDFITVLSWSGQHQRALKTANQLSPLTTLPDYLIKALSYSRATLTLKTPQHTQYINNIHERAVKLARQGNYSAAIPLIEQVCSSSEANIKAHYDRIVILSWAEKYQEASKLYFSLPNYKKRPVYFLTAAALSLKRTDKLEESLLIYREILSKESDNRVAIEASVNILMQLHRYNDAIALIDELEQQYSAKTINIKSLIPITQRVSKENNNIWDAYRLRIKYNEALSLARSGHHASAIAELRSLWQKEGKLELAQDLIVVNTWAEKYLDAIEIFESLPTNKHLKYYVISSIARAYEATHHPQEALSLYVNTLLRNKNNLDALQNYQKLLKKEAEYFFALGFRQLNHNIDHEEEPQWFKSFSWQSANHLQAIKLAYNGSLQQSLSQIRSEKNITFKTKKFLLDYAALLYISKHFKETAELGELLTETMPGSVAAASFACKANIARKNYDLALVYAKKWLALSPKQKFAASAVMHSFLAQNNLEEARNFVNTLPSTATWKQLLTADLNLYKHNWHQANEQYQNYLINHPKDAEAMLGQAAVLMQLGENTIAADLINKAMQITSMHDYAIRHTLTNDVLLGLIEGLILADKKLQANNTIDEILRNNNFKQEQLIRLGNLCEILGRNLDAVNIYTTALQYLPNNDDALIGRQRSLLRLYAVSVVREELSSTNEVQKPQELFATLSQQEALQHLSWRNSALAEPLMQTFATDRINITSRSAALVTYQVKQQYELAISKYEDMQRLGVDFDSTALRAAADAYFELEQPETALKLYRQLENRLQQQHNGFYPKNYTLKIAQLNCLFQLSRYTEIEDLLNSLDTEVPSFFKFRHAYYPNWDKASVVAERGWWLISQDKLAEAETYFKDMLIKAPRNSAALLGLAQTHQYRGWQRQALLDFDIAVAAHPNDLGLLIGYADSLAQRGQKDKALQISQKLQTLYPDNRQAQNLDRRLSLDKLTEVYTTSKASFGNNELSGLQITVGVNQPIRSKISIAATAGLKQETAQNHSADRKKATLGILANPTVDIKLSAAASTIVPKNKFGIILEAEYAPLDELSFILLADTNTWSLPPKAILAGVDAQLFTASGKYRHSELFSAEIAATSLILTDGNYIYNSNASILNRIFASGDLKLFARLEGDISHASLIDPAYYAPRQYWTILITPEIEHTWLQSRDYKLVDFISVTAGIQKEHGYDINERWRMRYAQTHHFAYRGEITFSGNFARQSYSGKDEYEWAIAAEAKASF
ncbi:MAG: tetratricopeptide repeat protein [Deltaproteobacteria bacterium]|nr:tetratricopeptide repeat protein [Deltaproteobacteria bacterium]